MSAPKLFVSYCWSSPDHEQWVLDLSTQLRDQGVDVILDKWDLQEGQDANAFMETMVNNPDVKKVIMIFDEVYATKANCRSGGVGTETMIISQKVYESATQNKFVAVLPCRDEHGKPFLPTYYSGRIFIDLSNPETREAESEKLLRWIFDKPLNPKPPIGSVPSFLKEGPRISLGTEASFNRAIDAIKSGKPTADGAMADYLETFADNLDRFQPVPEGEVPWHQITVERLEQFLPYRNQFTQFFTNICRYGSTPNRQRILHAFYEKLLPRTDLPNGFTGSYTSCQFDVYRFIALELFLYSVALALSEEEFDLANYLLSTPYFYAGSAHKASGAVSYIDFNQSISTVDSYYRAQGRNLNEPVGEYLKQRVPSDGRMLRSLMQAELVMSLRATLSKIGQWWPNTLVFAAGQYGPFEVFARCNSNAYFDRFKAVIAANNVSDLKSAVDDLNKDPLSIPRWAYGRVSIASLIDYQKIATLP